MAVVTLLSGTGNFSTTSGSKQSTVTPALGDLLIIATYHTGNTSSTTPTDNNADGLGAYTKITSATAQAGVDTVSIFVRNSLVGSATSTVVTHACGASTGGGIHVLKVTGMFRTGAAAVVQSAVQSNQGAGGTPTPVFSAAPSTNNAIISPLINSTNPTGMTVRSSPAYAKRGDVGYGTPTTGAVAMTVNSGETSTSIAWGSTSASAFGCLVIELDTRSLVYSSGYIF